MAAPHGACSEALLDAMAEVGFAAACISSGSLRAHNSDKKWTNSIGYSVAEVVAGLPLINRFSLEKGSETRVLLSAVFSPPLVPVWHHWDLVNGLGLL